MCSEKVNPINLLVVLIWINFQKREKMIPGKRSEDFI